MGKRAIRAHSAQEMLVSRESKPKPVKRLWHSQPGCVQLEGIVNGHKAMVLLDSGADISVVPESLVGSDQKTGSTVAVRAFGAQKPLILPTARVSFRIGDLEWEEGVAVAPRQEGVEEEVLYSLDLRSKRGLELVLCLNGVNQQEVLRVTTRAQSKWEGQEEMQDAQAVRAECPRTIPVPSALAAEPGMPGGPSVSDAPEETSKAAEREDRKEEWFIGGVLGRQDEDVVKDLGLEKESSVVQEEELYQIRKEVEGEPELVVPLVKVGRRDRDTLVKETQEDPSLAKWREHASKGESGFVWKRDLLYQQITTHTLEQGWVMVLPMKFRERVMVIAHDRMQHMGARRVTSIIKQRFTVECHLSGLQISGNVG